MKADSHYWFPAKRRGWGWGFPISWEGWVTLVVFVALIVAGLVIFPPSKTPGRLMIFTTVVSILMVAVGWFKGEPSRWRWGGD